jgi:hypothetical protein
MKKIGGEYEQTTRRQRYSHIPLLLLQVGQAAALDPRLVALHLPEDRHSKIRQMARNVGRIYHESHERCGVQLILMDRYRPLNVSTLEKLANVKFSSIRCSDIQVDDPVRKPLRRHFWDEEGEQGTFNAHRAARKACIEEGVSPDQVVVLNDAVKDIKSREGKALLDKVNAGLIRVLIATRDKIGTGVNIQTRLLALHEADPPRTLSPKGMRQGHGRIDRQGNLNKEISIYQYGMERTADAGIYHRLEMKARFIDQVLSGFVPGSNFDDPASETVQSLAELKAAITGDHRVIDLVRLQDDVRSLSLQRLAFNRRLGEKRRRLSECKSHAKSLSESTIPRFERLCELTESELLPRFFTKLAQSTTHIPVAWGDRQINATGKNLAELVNFIFTRGARPGLSPTVRIDELLFKLNFDSLLERQYYSYSLLDPADQGRVLYTAEVLAGGEGMLRSLEMLPARSVELLSTAKAELSVMEENIHKLAGSMCEDWPHEIELVSKKKQMEQLEAALEADESKQVVKNEDDWLTELEAEQNESLEENQPELLDLGLQSMRMPIRI